MTGCTLDELKQNPDLLDEFVADEDGAVITKGWETCAVMISIDGFNMDDATYMLEQLRQMMADRDNDPDWRNGYADRDVYLRPAEARPLTA